MTLLKGFGITLATGLLFAVMGAVIGLMVGKLVPEYYHMVFGVPEEHAYRIPLFGLVLGGLQGAGAGLLCGLVITGLVTWYQVRVQTLSSAKQPPNSATN